MPDFFFLILEYKTHLFLIQYIRKNVGVGGQLLHKHIPYSCIMLKKKKKRAKDCVDLPRNVNRNPWADSRNCFEKLNVA